MEFETISIGDFNLIPYYNKTKAEWEQIRRAHPTKIGGSDLGVLMGVNPYTTKAQLFDEKLWMTPPPDFSENQSVYWGNQLEKVILQASQYYNTKSSNDRNYIFNHDNNNKVNNHVSFDYTAYHNNFPWLAANIDGMNVNHGLTDKKIQHMVSTGYMPDLKNIVEIKTMSGHVHDKWAADYFDERFKGLPPGYVWQVMLYMAVYLELFEGEPNAVIYSLVDGSNLHAYTIEYDEDMASRMMEESYKFHLLLTEGLERVENTKEGIQRKRALDEIRPEADDSVAYQEHLTENYLKKIDINQEMVGNEAIQQLRDQYISLNDQVKNLDSKKRLRSNKIREILVKNEVSRISLVEGSIKYTSNNRLLIK